jgi:hypothetical protein
MKLPTLAFGIVAVIIGIILFRVKYEVLGLEHAYGQILKSIKETKESIHVLKAEWSHLNDPKRIQNLSIKFLTSIKPVETTQMVSFHDAAGGDKGYDKKALEDLIDAATSENKKHREAD